ncbi:hypothetical protein [Bacillus sp. SKDU12]
MSATDKLTAIVSKLKHMGYQWRLERAGELFL